MTGFPYSLTGPIGAAGTLGLIVLQVDETIEQDFRRLLPDPDLALYISRIPSGADLTRDSIARMETDLPTATSLLPAAAEFGAVGYACTSGTTLIGAERVADLVRAACRTRAVCNPLSAALGACEALGVRRLGIVSPYTADIADPVRAAFEAAGVAVPRTVSFGEEVEANVARIAPGDIMAAAQSVGDGVEAVFLSCTNLRTLDVIAPLEEALRVPVLSSNQVLAWSMARAAGVLDRVSGPGALFAA